jgi:hypothetical protein
VTEQVKARDPGFPPLPESVPPIARSIWRLDASDVPYPPWGSSVQGRVLTAEVSVGHLATTDKHE